MQFRCGRCWRLIDPEAYGRAVARGEQLACVCGRLVFGTHLGKDPRSLPLA